MGRRGGYYHSAESFDHDLCRDRLREIGFRVIFVERLPHHPVWEICLRGNLTAQTYLLVTKPMSKANACAPEARGAVCFGSWANGSRRLDRSP
jgi:hypothetical protein